LFSYGNLSSVKELVALEISFVQNMVIVRVRFSIDLLGSASTTPAPPVLLPTPEVSEVKVVTSCQILPVTKDDQR
jgi:hypothetical protein